MSSSYGAFEPEDAEAATPVSPLVRATQPRLPLVNLEANATHKRALAKVGGLLLISVAAMAVFMGGTSSEQPDAVSGGTSAVIATGLQHQQTSGVAYDEGASPFLDASTGTVMEVSAETTATAPGMDLAAAGAEGEDEDAWKTGDGADTSHSASWESSLKNSGVGSHEHSCGKGCTEYDDDDDGTSTPTAAPSAEPSIPPTSLPSTVAPTFKPTSAAPSLTPTSKPTAEPTSSQPTAEPTGGTTVEPTASPVPTTAYPSAEPTKTFEPTKYYELESEYDDDNLYRLVCADFDDDNV